MAITIPIEEARTYPARRCWTREEFEALGKLGVFHPEERLELIEGEIIEKMTQNSSHTTAIVLLMKVLISLFAAGFHLRIQSPLNLGTNSQPEPDVAVVMGDERQYAQAHPTTADLVIEVADSSLAYDRTKKAGIYARAGISEYWILNLVDRVLEVHRQPGVMTGHPLGHSYHNITTYRETESVMPLAMPAQSLAVADILP